VLLESFYVQNKDRLTAVLARYSGDEETAADAVQDAFLKALQNRDTLGAMQEKSLWSWLYTTAKNALIDEKRKTSRWEPFDGYDKAGPAENPDDMIVVRDLLHKLPSHLMHVVSLRYFGGLNATEIGRLTGTPPSTVRTQLRAAIKIMRSSMLY